MEEVVKLPLLEEDTTHRITLHGHALTVTTGYDESMVRVRILDEQEYHLRNVPLFFLFQFRDKQMYRSNKDTWSTQLDAPAGNSEFLTLKVDKDQVVNTKVVSVCSQYLSRGEDSDVVLSCGQYRVHANKERLAKKSAFFNALFNDNFREKNQEDIDINDMDGEVMHSILLISDDARFRITDFNLEPIMNAADRFGMESLMHKCADHLSINSKLGDFKRLLLLDKFSQENSIKELIDSMKSKMVIREDEGFDELSDQSQLKILREAVKELKKSLA